MKLSEELERWHCDRPDEWKMDEFRRNAEKLEAEINALAAQVKALKDLAEFWINQAKPFQPSEQEYKTWLALGYESKALRSSPKQHLAEIRAEAAERGYYQGFKDGLVIECPQPDGTNTASAVNYQQVAIEKAARMRADQYAANMRKGGK